MKEDNNIENMLPKVEDYILVGSKKNAQQIESRSLSTLEGILQNASKTESLKMLDSTDRNPHSQSDSKAERKFFKKLFEGKIKTFENNLLSVKFFPFFLTEFGQLRPKIYSGLKLKTYSKIAKKIKHMRNNKVYPAQLDFQE